MSETEARRRAVDRYGFLNDAQSRRARGQRIARALAEFGAVDLPTANVLDVGCSAGLIADEIAEMARCVIGIDADIESIANAVRRAGRPYFVVASGESLPFRDESFDAVICNHVYEHVDDATRLVAEIYRVLRRRGACYFAGGHTLQLIEPHYRLPLLSWLPRPLASRWLRFLRRGEAYTEKFVPPWRFRALLARFPDARFISTEMLREPCRYEFDNFSRWPASLRRAVLAAGVLPRLAPTWIYMLRKE